jgi:hypothetical protein
VPRRLFELVSPCISATGAFPVVPGQTARPVGLDPFHSGNRLGKDSARLCWAMLPFLFVLLGCELLIALLSQLSLILLQQPGYLPL